MCGHKRFLSVFVIAAAVLLAGAATGDVFADERSPGATRSDIASARLTAADVTEMIQMVKDGKAIIELGDASIIVETNDTDGDAGFQIFLDGDGWRNARLFAPSGQQVMHVYVSSGVRNIGGGTEFFMETAEPEYDDLDGLRDLVELLPEGEYLFLAKTTAGDWAMGMAELTHTIPDGPEVIQPVPAGGEECATDVPADFAVISWHPVTDVLMGSPDLEIVGYQVLVIDEEAGREFAAEVTSETTELVVPQEFLEPGTEYKFEILAIEESGNQTITESCFETAE